MATIHNESYHWDALSSDTKPTDDSVPNGSIIHEIDTGNDYQYSKDNQQWYKQ